MGLFGGDDEVILENAELDCEPQNEFVSKSEAKKIDKHLDPGEKVHYLAKDAGGGLKIDDGEKDVGTKGFIRTVATNTRVIITVPNMLNTETHVIPYGNISSVSHSSGVLRNRLSIESSSKTFGVDIGVLSDDACKDMTQFVRKMANEFQKQQQNETNTDSKSPLEKIEHLKQMNDDGIITDEEFQRKKEMLLDDV